MKDGYLKPKTTWLYLKTYGKLNRTRGRDRKNSKEITSITRKCISTTTEIEKEESTKTNLENSQERDEGENTYNLHYNSSTLCSLFNNLLTV